MVATGVLSRTQATAAYQETRLQSGKAESGRTGMNAIAECPESEVAGGLARGEARPDHFIFASSWPAILPLTRTKQVPDSPLGQKEGSLEDKQKEGARCR